MKLKILLAIFLASAALARADETIAKAQQALKDQGFYYGNITGDKNADTTAAIRRYQIRNGLQISGELDNETLHALEGEPSKPAQPSPKIAPSPTQEIPDVDPGRSPTEPQVPAQPFTNGSHSNDTTRAPERSDHPGAPVYPSTPIYPSGPAIVPPAGGLFAGTPYQSAPPDLQRDVVASTQRILAQRDLYRGEIDGVFGPTTEFSLRAYQARVGLPVTGRLDLETLAALDLLRGGRMPIFTPRRQIVRPRPEPPVRGEWIRD